MMNFSSWYEQNYPSLSGSGLWLRGGEPNTLPASEFDNSPFRILIARLSTYRDTADSFTHKLLYQIAASIPGTFPDMAFLPPPKDAEAFDRDNVPWLLGTTGKHGARDFSVVALSLSIVQELLNIAPLLRKSGIPLSRNERMADAACPLVILGGASALYASFLFGPDPCVDGIFAGEDAGTIRELFSLCREGVAGKRDKRALLQELRGVPGFFEPGGPIATSMHHSRSLPAGQLLERGPVMFNEGTIGTASLQISEGCAGICSFCAESFARKPYREFDIETLREAALRLKAAMAVETLELYSFNFSMHRSFHRLLEALVVLFPEVGLKSQRLDSIAFDPELLKFLHAAGKSSLTFGIEGISPRLRRYLHKDLGERDIQRGMHAVLTAPIRELKFFLIATGLEEQADYDAFRSLLALMGEILRGSARAPRIIFSMTMLVRFPGTPLEFEDAPEPGICRKVVEAVERLVRAAGFEFRTSAGTSDYWISQLLVRLADPRVAEAVRVACVAIGFVYYRDIPTALVSSIREQLALRGIPADEPFRGHSPASRSQKPWSGIETGVGEAFLAAQWKCAIASMDQGQAEEVPIALPARDRSENRLPIDRFRELIAATRRRKTVIHFRVNIDSSLRDVPPAMRGTLLAKALMAAEPGLVPEYWGNCGSQVAGTPGWERATGDDVVALAWLSPADELVRERLADALFVRTIADRCGQAVTLIGPASSGPETVAEVIFTSPFPFDPFAYSSRKSLKYTLCKTGEHAAEYRLSRDSLRKKILSRCTVEQGGDGLFRVSIVPGPKFSPGEFAETAFTVPGSNEWVRIIIEAKFKD